jgi:flagellar biogenesis protein FliO
MRPLPAVPLIETVSLLIVLALLLASAIVLRKIKTKRAPYQYYSVL